MLSKFFLFRWIKILFQLYIDAFRYRLAKRLFLIIAIKMFILFAILKAFFFHDYLDERFSTDQQKAQYVLDNLTNYPVTDSIQTQSKN